MATFWTWGVRNPCALVAVLAAASGFTGVLDWSAAMMFTTATLVMADAGHHLGSKARRRKERARAASEAVQAAIALRQRITSETADLRRAA